MDTRVEEGGIRKRRRRDQKEDLIATAESPSRGHSRTYRAWRPGAGELAALTHRANGGAGREDGAELVEP